MNSSTGMQLIYVASKGRLRYAHRILTVALQIAAKQNCNHSSDDVLQKAIEELVA